MVSFTFTSPFDLANFIDKQLNVSDARIEQLMNMGLQHRQVNGNYKIAVNIDEIKGETLHYLLSLKHRNRGEVRKV